MASTPSPADPLPDRHVGRSRRPRHSATINPISIANAGSPIVDATFRGVKCAWDGTPRKASGIRVWSGAEHRMIDERVERRAHLVQPVILPLIERDSHLRREGLCGVQIDPRDREAHEGEHREDGCKRAARAAGAAGAAAVGRAEDQREAEPDDRPREREQNSDGHRDLSHAPRATSECRRPRATGRAEAKMQKLPSSGAL